MRKLASIQKINDLQSIEGADLIERATVLGWHLVVKKGEFKVGDYCIYCEVDSILPELPEFEFLRPRHFRIKTIRMRGQISQGIAFPVSLLPNLPPKEGTDITELLGVIKYEPPIPIGMGGQTKGAFPGFIPKTDETRIQSVPDVLTRAEGTECYISEKVDGTSATYYMRDGEFGVCSRNLDLLETEKNIHWKVARQEDMESKLQGHNIAIQGEIIGPGVQGNKYKLATHELRVFNIFDIDHYVYLNYDELVAFIAEVGLSGVPLLQTCVLGEDGVDGLVALAEAKSVVYSKIHCEGIVIRSKVEQRDPELGRLSFKVINPKFLLKYD